MAIEIRELHIKAVIDAGGSKKANEPASDTAKAEGPEEGGGSNQLIDLCVEKILEILKEKTER